MKKLLVLLVIAAVLVVPFAIKGNQSAEQVFATEDVATSNVGGLFDEPEDYTVSGNKIVKYNGGETLFAGRFPEGVNTIGINAFTGSTILLLGIPDSITNIQAGAFWNSNIAGIQIPASVTHVGTGAFYRCTSLVCIEIMVEDVTVFEFGQISYAPSEIEIHVPYYSLNSYRSSLRFGTYRNKISCPVVTVSFVGVDAEDAEFHMGQYWGDILPEAPEKPGYVFDGWYARGKQIDPNEKYFDGYTSETVIAQYSYVG